MTSWDENYGIVKGWLIAREAPPAIMDALEGLRGERPQAHTAPETRLGPPTNEESTAGAPPPETKPRKKPVWSDEQRAAAAERMRKARAAKEARRHGETLPTPADDDVDITRLPSAITNPLPRPNPAPQLDDADWPEVSSMLVDGRSSW